VAQPIIRRNTTKKKMLFFTFVNFYKQLFYIIREYEQPRTKLVSPFLILNLPFVNVFIKFILACFIKWILDSLNTLQLIKNKVGGELYTTNPLGQPL
jgi:hypothetical protein